MNKKLVDTREYISVLRELTEDGKEVSLTVAGNSMAPFLVHERDTICFSKPHRPLKKGDMVFYQRVHGQFIMHRICRVAKAGYYMIGDAQTMIEGPIPENSVFAVVTKVCRNGKWIDQRNFWWFFFEKIWIRMIPMRSLVRRGYGLLKKLISIM